MQHDGAESYLMLRAQVRQFGHHQYDVWLLGLAVGHAAIQFVSDELDYLQCRPHIMRVNGPLQHMGNAEQLVRQAVRTADHDQPELRGRSTGNQRRQQGLEYGVCPVSRGSGHQHVAERVPVGGEDLAVGKQPHAQQH
jgi:hypothetical protein